MYRNLYECTAFGGYAGLNNPTFVADLHDGSTIDNLLLLSKHFMKILHAYLATFQ